MECFCDITISFHWEIEFQWTVMSTLSSSLWPIVFKPLYRLYEVKLHGLQIQIIVLCLCLYAYFLSLVNTSLPCDHTFRLVVRALVHADVMIPYLFSKCLWWIICKPFFTPFICFSTVFINQKYFFAIPGLKFGKTILVCTEYNICFFWFSFPSLNSSENWVSLWSRDENLFPVVCLHSFPRLKVWARHWKYYSQNQTSQ